VILTFSFLIILWILIRNPITKLTDVVKKISEGNYELRADSEELIDDIKILASRFNQMADNIIASEKRFRELAELLPLTVCEVDISRKLLYVNSQGFKLFGYRQNEFPENLNVLDFIDDTDKERALDNFVRTLNGKAVDGYEYTVVKKDGTKFSVAIFSSVIYKDDKPIGLRSVLLDLSEKKEAEEKFRAIVQGLMDMIFIIDSNGKISYISPSVTKISGFTENDMVGKNPADFIHPDDVELAMRDLIEVFQMKNDGLPTLFRARCKDGSYIYAESIGINMLKNRFVNGVVVFARNVTERIISQKNLQESERRFSNLLLNIQDPILIISYEGIIKYANPACYKLIQADESINLMGVSFTKFMNEKEIIKAFNDISIIQNSGESITSLYEIKTFKDETRYISVTGAKIKYENDDSILSTIKDITEIKTAQNVLEQSEKRFRTVWESTLDAMRITDEIGTIVIVNQAYCNLVKKSREDLIGMNLSIVSHESFRDEVRNNYIINFKNRNLKAQYEDELELWNGDVISVEIAHSFLELDNQSTLLLTVFHNITEKKETQKKLEENEKKYRNLVENLNEAIVYVDNNDKILFVNNKFSVLTGYSSDEVLGKIGYEFLIPPTEKQKILYSIDQRIKGLSSQYEVKFIKKNGEEIIFLINGAPVIDSNGKTIGSIGAMTDITERKKAEEIIKTTSENFRRIFENAPFGMVITTADSNALILNVNKAACRIIEKSPEDLLNKSSNLFIEDSVSYELSLKFQTDRIIKDFEYAFTTQNGKKKILLLSTFFIEYDNKLCTLNVIEDITEKKQNEIELEQYRLNLENLIQKRTAELEEVNKKLNEEIIKQKQAEEKVRKALEKEKELSELKSKFITIASHEFRTPLATMLSSTDLVEFYHKNNLEEKFNIQLERIRNNINHLTGIIDNLLVISKVDSGKIEFEQSYINSFEFMSEIYEDTKVNLLPNQTLKFNNSIPDKYLFIDKKLFRIVLMNIISNAIKYSPNGGEIEIELYSEDGQIVFKISDNGIGISEKDRNYLFQEFYRATNVGNLTGSGIGLTIVKKYVELHNGKIEIYSKEGEGTIFWVYIPEDKK